MERYAAIIATLVERQHQLGENDRDFAARMGMTHPMWGMLRRGKTTPGRRTLEKIGRAFPDLRLDIANALFFLPEDSKILVPSSTTGEQE